MRSRAVRTASSIAVAAPSGSSRGYRRGGVPCDNGFAAIEVVRCPSIERSRSFPFTSRRADNASRSGPFTPSRVVRSR